MANYITLNYDIPSQEPSALPEKENYAVGQWFYEELEERGIHDTLSGWLFMRSGQPPAVEQFLQRERQRIEPLLADRRFMSRLTWKQAKIVKNAFKYRIYVIHEVSEERIRARALESLNERAGDMQNALIVKISEVADSIREMEHDADMETGAKVLIAGKKRAAGVAQLTSCKAALARAITAAECFDVTMDCERLFDGIRHAVQAQEKVLEAQYARTIANLTKDALHR